MKRILFLLWAILLTTIVLAGLVFWILKTPSGAKSSIKLINSFAPVKIHYSDLKGNLGSLELSRLDIESAGGNIKAEKLTIEWSPLTALFQKDVVIEKLAAKNVFYKLADKKAPTQTVENIDWRLPFTLELKSAVVDTLHIPEIHTEAIKNISLKAQLEKEEWIINEFSLEHPTLSANLKGQLIPFNQLRHSLKLKFQTIQFGEGDLISKGNSEQSDIIFNLPEHKTTLTASISNWLKKPNYDFSAAIDSPKLLGTPAKIKINGTGKLSEGTISVDGIISDKKITIEKLDYRQKDKEFSVLSKGVLSDGPFVLKADFSKDKLIQSELSWIPKVTIDKVKIKSSLTRISGNWNNLDIINESQAIIKGQKTKLSALAQLKNFKTLSISPSKLSTLGGELTVAGKALLQTPITLDLTSNAKNIQLEKIDSRLPQLQSGLIKLNWSKDKNKSSLNASLSNLSAIINSSPVTGNGELKISKNIIQLASLNLNAAGENSIKLELLDPVNQLISIDSNINDLGAFLNKASGVIKGKVNLGLKTTLINGQLDASNLQVPELLTLDEASIEASHPENIQQIDIQGTGLKLKEYRIKKAEIGINGTPELHLINVNLIDMNDRTLSIDAQGQELNADYLLNFQNLSSSSQELGQLNNQNTIELFYSKQKLQLKPFCLNSEIIQLCGDLQAGDSVNGQFNVNILATENNKKTNQQMGTVTLIPKTNTEIKANFQIKNKQFSKLDFDASLSKLAVRNQDDESMEIDNLILSANGENNNIQLNFNAEMAGGNIGMQGVLSGDINNPNIEATLNGNIPKLEDISPLLISTDIRQGDFLFELLVKGKIKTPTVSGLAKVNNTKVHIPELGTTQNIALDLDLRDASNGRIKGLINSGQGQGLLEGSVKWQKKPIVQISLSGTKLLIADTKSLSLSASPDLILNYQASKLDLNGNIKIDNAFTSLASTGTNTSLSNDVVFVGTDDELDSTILNSQQLRNINVTTEFIKPARIESFGLVGDVTGKLRITQKDSGPVLANGQLSITGQYKAFGQELQIESGRLNYLNTALDNPTIEFYATRKVEDVKVGVRVSGRPNSLISTLESTPSMREAEILNYLVLGKAPGAASEAESNQLTQAAVALALARSESGIQNVAGKAGLSDLSLTQELGGLALSLGKQLSPRLYIGYTMGFIEPINIAKVRYILSSKWILESEISDENRGILKYRFEKD